MAKAAARAVRERVVEPLDDLDRAKIRKWAADARLSELAVAEREGQLLSLKDFQRELQRPLSRLRARLLSMPSKWAPTLVGCRTTQEAHLRLEAAVNEAMEAMRDELADESGEAVDGGGDPPRPRRRPEGRQLGARPRPSAHRK